MNDEKPIVSRRVAAVLSILLIIVIIFALYFLAYGMRGGGINIYNPPKPPPEEEKWELSPLVAQYNIGTTTPVLVVNCRYVFIGSEARAESRGAVPQGTERENIGEALCFATNNSVLCSKFRGMPKFLSGVRDFPECKKGNKTIVYAFHNPFCPISTAQRDILDAFRNEFSKQVAVEYICVPTSEEQKAECSKEFLIGKYDK